jgi:hypothetical protein
MRKSVDWGLAAEGIVYDAAPTTLAMNLMCRQYYSAGNPFGPCLSTGSTLTTWW